MRANNPLVRKKEGLKFPLGFMTAVRVISHYSGIIMEFNRHFPPRRVKDRNRTELEKCDCVSSVMNIAPILGLDREK